MHQHSRFSVRGHHLVTRFGVNTGRVIAGNLGSALRFDYTLTGDPVNFASRLEGLNKYLGTQVLISESTWKSVRVPYAVRSVGKFCVKGKKQAIEVYELLGPSVAKFVQAAMDTFAEGLKAYCAGDLAAAKSLMQQTRTQRGGSDGPSEFYLKKIGELEQTGLPKEWDGVITLDEK